MTPIRIGTRGSALAMWQAHSIEAELRRHGFATQIVEIGTRGDRDNRQPIAELGVEGVFTKEIQRALLDGAIDLAVHSLKDLPTEPVEGLEFVASPRRGPFRDAFVSNVATDLDALPDGSVIGTGSVRRKAQLLNLYGSRFQIADIRGNVETRLKKLDAGEYAAVILAEAGLVRLGLDSRVASPLEPPQFLPAIGQGTLGIEARVTDAESLRDAIDCLNDPPTFAAVIAERSLLRSLRGGCLAPVAALGGVEFPENESMQYNRPTDDLATAAIVTLTARVLSPDGRQRLEASQRVPLNFAQDMAEIRETASQLGRDVADELLAAGADHLLRGTPT